MPKMHIARNQSGSRHSRINLNNRKYLRRSLMKKRFFPLLLVLFHILLISSTTIAQDAAAEQDNFHNPLLPSGPDPWVTSRNGFYYYMNTTGRNLTIWKTRDITDLAHAEKKVVWTPPDEGPYSHEIWAPELHLLDGKWYIYF